MNMPMFYFINNKQIKYLDKQYPIHHVGHIIKKLLKNNHYLKLKLYHNNKDKMVQNNKP